MDLKVIDKKLLEINNIRIISAILMVILSRRGDETQILNISPEFMTEININYHIRNPELFKKVFLMFVEVDTFRVKYRHEVVTDR